MRSNVKITADTVRAVVIVVRRLLDAVDQATRNPKEFRSFLRVFRPFVSSHEIGEALKPTKKQIVAVRFWMAKRGFLP